MKKFHMTLFGAIVLVIVLMAIYGAITGKQDPLFDKGTRTTLYAETEVGKEPEIKAENYFSAEDYDLSRFTFDFSACSWEEEGVYQIPVLYDGKETNCTVSLIVAGPTGNMPEMKPGVSGDTELSNIE